MASQFVLDANSENFNDIVLPNSQQLPIWVDFWADWCQPCKSLMPILEDLAEKSQGLFALVKVNADENPRLLEQYGVRSLPTVKIFRMGQVVDEFQGVRSQDQLKSLVEKHRIRATEPYRQQALSMQEAGDRVGAIALLQQVLEHEPDFVEARLDLAQAYFEEEEFEKCRETLSILPEDRQPEALVQKLNNQEKIMNLKAELGDVSIKELEQKLIDNPDDLESRCLLAQSCMAEQNFELALSHYFYVMQKDRQFKDDAGRKGMMSIFDLLVDGPLVNQYRSKLFSLLY